MKKLKQAFRKKILKKINWAQVNKNNFDYYFWQDAGPWNALGNVIFQAPNPYQVYLHDTPDRHLFHRRIRSFSAGCVRIEKAMELAKYLLKNNPDWDKERINQLISQNREKQILLSEPVPLYLVYLTTWVNQRGQLNMRHDIYERDQKLLNNYFNY